MKNNSYNSLDDSQNPACKIFVGGLSWNTTKEMLINEFSKYGEIIDSVVMKNPETGNSRGFGFVNFKDTLSAENAVSSGSQRIDGKIVDVKLCNPRIAAQQRNNKQKSDNCKVFVGGLPHGVTDDQIKQFFSRYGLVKDFKMMYDENKQRPRGFGFVTFESEESANQVLKEHYIQFNGKQIEVKPQIHNVKQQNFNFYQQSHLHLNTHVQYPNSNWNTNWNQQNNLANGGNVPHLPINNGSLNAINGTYGNTMNVGPSQHQWNYATTVQVPGITYAANSAHGATQPNWNYNYYGHAQPNYYHQSEISGTGTFNF